MGTLALFPLNPFLAEKITADSCLEGCAGCYKLRKSCWWTRVPSDSRSVIFGRHLRSRSGARCSPTRPMPPRGAQLNQDCFNRMASTGWPSQPGYGRQTRVWDYRLTRLLCTWICHGLSTFLTLPDSTGDKMSPLGDLTGTDSPWGPSAVH